MAFIVYNQEKCGTNSAVYKYLHNVTNKTLSGLCNVFPSSPKIQH